MSIKFSSVLTGIVFAVAFTVPQKAQAQTRSILEQETGDTPQTTETEAIPKPPPHPPYLIHELLYQVNEVNRRLQAGVVIQCRCNNDYWWWAFNEAVKTTRDDSADDSQSHWSVIPEYKKIVRGYGHNMKEAKWDAMRACDPIAFVPIEEENPPEVGPIGDGSQLKAEEVGIDGDPAMEKALMWCHHSKRFLP